MARGSYPHDDWFMAAIEAEGSVDHCLGAVLSELNRRASLIRTIQVALVPREDKKAPDAISEISDRIKLIDNTLRFRLGILRPERAAAWFRAPSVTNSGPFSTAIVALPVFGKFDPSQSQKVKESIRQCWERRSLQGLPFSETDSLWRSLIHLNIQVDQISKLEAPFSGLSLEMLPDGLPPDLESRALRAFLLNVRSEIRMAREKLQDCFERLFEASDRFWEYHTRQAQEERERTSERASQKARRRARRNFEHRRRDTQTLASVDLEALHFMGFDDLPDHDELRARYLALAKRMHPDAQFGNDDQFKHLARAYSRLSARVGAKSTP